MELKPISVSISTDKTVTVAEVAMASYPASTISGAGSSVRDRGDKYDKEIGDDLALARALRSMAARLERRARARVRHIESVKMHRAEIKVRKQSVAVITYGKVTKTDNVWPVQDPPETPVDTEARLQAAYWPRTTQI